MKLQSTLVAAFAALMFASCGQSTPSATEATDAVASDSAIVVNTIMSRHSIRKYKETPVEQSKLQTVVNCGVNAPNAMNYQPWAVRVVDSKEYIDGVTEVYKKANAEQVAKDANFKNMFRNAPAIIAVANDTTNHYSQVDCGLMGENMIIAAQAMGLGTCVLGGPVRFLSSDPEAKPYLDKLELPENYALLYIIAIGYPDESPEAKPRDMSKVKFVK